MGKEKRVVVNPPARLDRHAGDLELPLDRYLQLSFFGRLKKKPNLEKFPETLRLRHYRKGEVICRQGEAGWTAFYVLAPEDVAGLSKDGLIAPQQDAVPASGEQAHVATVHLALARSVEQGPRGLLGRLRHRLRGTPGRSRPRFIPIDAPRGADYESR
jgi:hypothetical protein